LKNEYVELAWDIDLISGTGDIEITRDDETEISLGTIIEFEDWTFSKTIELKNSYVQLAWEVNRDQRFGNIIFQRDIIGGDPTITFALSHNTWSVADTLELTNDYIEFYWDLPDDISNHAEVGVITSGDEIFYNTISIIDDSVEIFSLGVGLKTEDHFWLSWDNIGGVISNFEWSGKILTLSSLDVAVNLEGDLFAIDGNWHVGESGDLSLAVNKDVTVNFVDIQTNRFDINGYIDFDANRQLDIFWDLQDDGYFRVSTNGDPLGDEASFHVLFDPQNQGNWRYGINLTAPEFLRANFNVSWQADPFLIWVAAPPEGRPGNWVDWEKWLLWNYNWYEIPSIFQ
jgi:hypothetical protein